MSPGTPGTKFWRLCRVWVIAYLVSATALHSGAVAAHRSSRGGYRPAEETDLQFRCRRDGATARPGPLFADKRWPLLPAPHPIFSRAQLIRKLLRHTKRVSAVFFSDAGRSLHQLQDCAAGRVELVTGVCSAFFSPRKRDHIRLGVAASDSTMHHSALPLDLNNHIAGRAFDCGVLRLAHEFRRSNGLFVWTCCG